jgi:hypothetical protein
MDIVEKVIDALVVLLIVFALIGVIVTNTNSLTWSALNIGGTVYNMSWFPFVLVILIIAGIITALVYHFKHK